MARSSKRPEVLKPVAVGKKPSKRDHRFQATDVEGEWALGWRVPTSLTPGKTYDLGITTSDRYTIRLRVVA